MPAGMNRRCLLAGTFAVLAAGVLPVPIALAEVAIGRVSVLLGEAWRETAGDAQPLQPGAAIRRQDRLITGAESRLEIVFAEGSVLTVGPLSRVEVQRFAPPGTADAAAEAIIALVAGILKVAVNDAADWDSFQVETSTAVASVRGTEWVMEETPDGSAVLVLAGQVAVRGKGAAGDAGESESTAVIVAAGEGTDVAAGAMPTPPKIWGEKRRLATLARVALP